MVFERIRRLDARGFSLAELIIVVAVIGVLAAIGMPTFLSYWKTATIKAAAQEVVAALNVGRQLAIKENLSVCVKTDAGTGAYATKLRYVLGGCGSGTLVACATNPATPCVWTGAGTDPDGYVTLANRMEANASSEVLFSYLGAATTAGTYTVRETDTTSPTATVTVAGSGRVTYTFP